MLIPLYLTGLALLGMLLHPLPEDRSSALCDVVVDAGMDTSLCIPGGTVQLDGSFTGQGVAWEWTPTTGLNDPGSLNPTASVSSDMTYQLTVFGADPGAPNLVTNGDFEQGNGFFSSDYSFVMDDPLSQVEMWGEGTYSVVANPNLVHSNFASCDDHTGAGNMLVLNGAPNYQQVWCQSITVSPDQYYNFEAWVASVVGSSPAQLQFSINGTNIGNVFNATSATCVWEQFNAIWFSGSISSAEICIVNLNTQPSGNDFAIDDIAFYELCQATDEVTISLIDEPAPIPEIMGPDIACIGDNLTFSIDLPDSPIVQSIHWWTTGNGSVTGPDGLEEAQFTWNIPGMTEVCIDLETRCSSAQNCFPVLIEDIPAPPVISGPSQLCLGDFALYTVVPDEYADQILWTTSAGATLLSDPTGEEAQIIWDNTGLAEVCVAFSNHCGTSQTCLPVDIHGVSYQQLDTTFCNGSTLTVNGTVYDENNTSGTETMVSSTGCDSIVEINIEIVETLESLVAISLCQGDSIMLQGEYQTYTGIFRDTFMTVMGCDSIATTELTFVDADTHLISAVTCDPSGTGTSTQVFDGTLCDSIVITEISLAPSDSIYFSLSSCNPADTGTTIESLTNAFGCDSVVITEIQYALSDSSHNTMTTCDSSLAGLQSETFTNSFGCDSVVVTEVLYVGVPQTYVFTESCDPSTAGIDTVRHYNTFGCDSIVITETLLLPSDTTRIDAFTCNASEAGSTSISIDNRYGCDSTIITTTTLLEPEYCELVIQDDLIARCPGDLSYYIVTAIEGLVPVSVQLTNLSLGTYEYLTLGDLNEPDTFGLTQSGTYLVEAFSAAGIEFIDSFEIFIPDSITLAFSIDTTSNAYEIPCYGQTISAISTDVTSGGQPPFDFIWSDSSTTNMLSQVGAGTYAVTVTDRSGCTSSARIVIDQPPPLTADVISTDISCYGQQDGSVSIIPSGGFGEYQIQLNDDITEPGQTGLAPGVYQVLVMDANGCTVEDTAIIVEPAPLEIDIGPDTSIAYGQSVTIELSASHPLVQITWWPVSCQGCTEVQLSPEETGTVEVIALDSNGCMATDDLLITVDKLRGIYAPNVFSPNGDGINDYFYLNSPDPDARVDRLEVFNRWGEIVFAATDIPVNNEMAGWDGHFRNQGCLPGVYVFSATVRYPDGFSDHVKGDVTLIR